MKLYKAIAKAAAVIVITSDMKQRSPTPQALILDMTLLHPLLNKERMRRGNPTRLTS